jgi:hypothetical protein
MDTSKNRLSNEFVLKLRLMLESDSFAASRWNSNVSRRCHYASFELDDDYTPSLIAFPCTLHFT